METQTIPNAFEHMPRTIRSHFLLNLYMSVYRLLYYMHQLSQVGGEELREIFTTYPFLKGYFSEMLRSMPRNISWDSGWHWWVQEVSAWEQSSDTHLPLCSLTDDAELDFTSRVALMLVGLVEEDSRFGTLFARLQEPLPYRRPCLETVGQILARTGRSTGPDAWSICRPLLHSGLVDVANQDAPRSEWVLRVPGLVWDILKGQAGAQPTDWCQFHTPDVFPALSELVFPDAFLQHLEQVPALVWTGKTQALVLRGMQGSERLDVLGAIARTLGQGIVEVLIPPGRSGEGAEMSDRHWRLLGTVCAMSRCMPVMTLDLGPGETVELPSLTGYSGPLGVMMGFEGGLKGTPAEKALTLTLPTPAFDQRLRHWQAVFGQHQVENLVEITERFHLPGGYIRQAGGMAMNQATLNRRATVTLDDVRAACRSLNRQLLDTLADHLEASGSWDHLVVSDLTAAKLRDLELRCHHRERLLDHLGPGFASNSNRGVRALFTGGSGTGKTLAARLLAAELGIDLYRVDLSAVINKYIGETEKNLHRVLARAEELDVILLLDEGDTLLGKRTEVKSSNDRYANLETNYLLQRLEHYQGIVIITTNAGQHIDTAFQRRIDVVVHFVPPQARERWLIWQLHLPASHAVEAAYLEEISIRCELNGGQIRNTALNAALLALDEGGVVERRHLEAALQGEYRKAGAISPLNRNGHGRTRHDGMDAFLNAMMCE